MQPDMGSSGGVWRSSKAKTLPEPVFELCMKEKKRTHPRKNEIDEDGPEESHGEVLNGSPP